MIVDTSTMNQEVLHLLRKSEQAKLKGNHKEAVNLAENALSIDTESIEALEEIGDNYLALEKLKKSKVAAEFALELNPDSYTALYILWFIASRNNKFGLAIKYLIKANNINPNHSEILRCLGWAYCMTENNLKWIVILERALSLNKNDPYIICDLWVAYLKNNNKEKALDLFYQALKISPKDKRIIECINIAESK